MDHGAQSPKTTSETGSNSKVIHLGDKHRALPGKTKSRTDLPVAHDSQGRALYIRPSDSKLVYLRCYVANCERTNFRSVTALRFHVCHALGQHKMKGLFASKTQAIEICGIAAPGQENFGYEAGLQSFRAASVVNTGAARVETSSFSHISTHDCQRNDSERHDGGASVWSPSSTVVGFDKSRSSSPLTANARDLASVKQEKFSNHSLNPMSSDTRAQQAAELCEGHSNIDFEYNGKAESIKSIRPSMTELHVAACQEIASGNRTITGAELFDICTNVEQRIQDTLMQDVAGLPVKEEFATQPSLAPGQSPDNHSPLSLNIQSTVTSSTDGNGNEVGGQDDATNFRAHRKRCTSDPPGESPPLQKRFRKPSMT